MAFQELKKDLIDANADIKSYLEYSEEYLKLRVFRLYMISLTSFTQILVLSAIAILTLVILSTAISIALGNVFNSYVYGFMAVGLVYLILGVLCYFFRNQMNKPILRKFSKEFFNDDL